MSACGGQYREEFKALDTDGNGTLSMAEYAAARGGGGGNQNGGDSGENCEDCVQVVKNWKTVQVPCHRNTYKQYTVKVARQVTENVPKTVKFTTMEKRTKVEPYTETRMEKRTKYQTINVQVPVTKTVTKMVKKTKKVPKTIYVDVTTMEPVTSKVTSMETQQKQIKIPYMAPVKVQKTRTVNYEEPVTKSKVIMDKVTKTVYDTQVRTRCEPKVTMVSKRIPVYNVVARPAQPCPPANDGGNNNSGGGEYQGEFKALDTDGSGGLSYEEYAAARGGGGGNQMQSAGAGMAAQSSNAAAAVVGGGGGGGGQYQTEFTSLDTNQDGQLSYQEYAAARTQG